MWHFFVIYRKCQNCQKLFASDIGLEDHVTRNKNKSCGIYAATEKRRATRNFFQKRRSLLKAKKFMHLGQMKNMAAKRKKKFFRPRTKMLSLNFKIIFALREMSLNRRWAKILPFSTSTFLSKHWWDILSCFCESKMECPNFFLAR